MSAPANIMFLALRLSTGSAMLRRTHIRELFLARCPVQRTANDVLNFFLWLRQCAPDLLPEDGQGDAYRRLKAALDGLFLNE